MTLQVTTRFPGGNAALVEIGSRDGLPEIRFHSDPCGAPEALWFYLRIEESKPDPAQHTKIRLTWVGVDALSGQADTLTCIPVASSPGHTWSRLKQGDESRNEHGLREVSWLIPHPAPSVEVALCFPYGKTELDNLLDRSRDFWRSAVIGISQGARPITRVYNTLGQVGSSQPGIFLLARQHGGDTPGSWVLDGFLRFWAQQKKGGYVVWSVPWADADGVEWGWTGRDTYPADIDRSWTIPPLRQESLVISQDLQRWKTRCKPILAIDLQAPGAFDKDGVFAFTDAAGPTAADETKWCNVLKNELKAEFAAPEFQRPDQRPARSAGSTFAAYARAQLGVPAVVVQIPFGLAAGAALSQKQYREIGQRIAQAVLRRNG
jgi:hypothetical protein